MDLGRVFVAAVVRRPTAPAIVDGDIRRTYRQWFDDATRVAGGMAALGLDHGDHVVCLLKNRYEVTVLYWACQLLGLIYTPLNWRSTGADVAYCLEDANVRAVVYEGSSETAAHEALARHPGAIAIGIADAVQAPVTFASLITSEPLRVFKEIDEHDVCMMLYTSGTTGRPKGVPRSHRNEISAAISLIANNQYGFGEVSLGVMPMYHTMGVRVLLASALLSGIFVCMPRYDTELALRLIQDERVSALFLVPTLFHDMVVHPAIHKYARPALTNLGYAGMTMTDALSEACMKIFQPKRWINYYGSSEIFTFSFCDYLDVKPGCAGHAGFCQELRVVRADPGPDVSPDEVLAPGEVGEIIATLSSPEAFRGYWNQPAADVRAIRNGWYFTGDLGRVDDDGDLWLLGRVDDMIISGGENIHPEEVENILSRCPLVSQVAVVGVDDLRYGTKVIAFVEPTSADASHEALDDFCVASELGRFKRPRGYVFVEQVPKSGVGKILRRELKLGHYKRLSDFKHTD
ncbi:MAG: long-chain fatty acid--CoA ligase [Burkholderiaceae bacterium]|nr:MAG: long-chain fatty acid--CoA ligase [Burkholderiaceae bacterium]TAM05902.1 MAG: long-chain fatty acid--CoA ligase [Pusillimonas sp.]